MLLVIDVDPIMHTLLNKSLLPVESTCIYLPSLLLYIFKGEGLSEEDRQAEKEREVKRKVLEAERLKPVTYIEEDVEDFILDISL